MADLALSYHPFLGYCSRYGFGGAQRERFMPLVRVFAVLKRLGKLLLWPGGAGVCLGDGIVGY
jgi:hypothetical protein